MAQAPKVQNFPAPPLLSPLWEDKKKTVLSRPWVEYFRSITTTLGANAPVTGSKASGAALTSLINQLEKLGLISDQTTD